MRKHPFHIVLRMRFHNLSLPQMPSLPCPCSLLLRAVLSPSSSIKLSHVSLWSAVHSLSHHCTISLPTSCWNRTLREPFSCSLGPPSRPKAGDTLTAAPLSGGGSMCVSAKQTHQLSLWGVCVVHVLKNYEMCCDQPTEATICAPHSQVEKIKIVLVFILLDKKNRQFSPEHLEKNQVV